MVLSRQPFTTIPFCAVPSNPKNIAGVCRDFPAIPHRTVSAVRRPPA
ncbi:hypothetical protein AB6A40_011255, partial [Gnathostoma spinigerum]